MPKVTSAFFDDEDTPELRFEESGNTPAPQPRRAASYAAAAPAPAYGIEDDRYAELKDKQASMLRLQQELEQTQREARELETRRAKEERFNDGRREVCEHLSRSLAKLDRELYNAQKAVEEISSARECYQHHLDALRTLQPDSSGHTHSDDDMDRAIGAVEDAENEFSKTSRRLSTVLPQLGTEAFTPNTGTMPHDFGTWMRCGAAFSIPLALAAVVVAVILKLLA